MAEIKVLVTSAVDFFSLTLEEQHTRLAALCAAARSSQPGTTGAASPAVSAEIDGLISVLHNPREDRVEKSPIVLARQLAESGLVIPVVEKKEIKLFERLRTKMESMSKQSSTSADTSMRKELTALQFSHKIVAIVGTAAAAAGTAVGTAAAAAGTTAATAGTSADNSGKTSYISIASGDPIKLIGFRSACPLYVNDQLLTINEAAAAVKSCQLSTEIMGLIQSRPSDSLGAFSPLGAPPAGMIPDDLGIKHDTKYFDKFGVVVFSDIYNRILADAYYAMPDETLLDEYKLSRSMTAARLAANRADIVLRNQLSTVITISRDKLKVPAAILAGVSRAQTLAQAFTLLGKYGKLAKTEYEHRLAWVRAVAGSNCRHLEAVRAFNRDRNPDSFKAVQPFMNIAAPDEMHNCRECALELICPHVVELMKLTAAGASFYESATAMQKYAIDRVRGGATASDSHCRICREVIIPADTFGDITGDAINEMDEELKNLIWGEVMGCMRVVTTSGLVNMKRLTTIVRDAIYPYMFEIEKQVLKSKTSTADEIKSKKRLFATIFGMAMLTKLATGGYGIGFKGVQPGATVPALLQFVIKTIINTKNVYIRAIPGMTAENVQNQVISAYKTLSLSRVELDLSSTSEEPLDLIIMLDSVFDFMFTIMETTAGVDPRKGDRTERKVAAIHKLFSKYMLTQPKKKKQAQAAPSEVQAESDLYKEVPAPPAASVSLARVQNTALFQSAFIAAVHNWFYRYIISADVVGPHPSSAHDLFATEAKSLRDVESRLRELRAPFRARPFGVYRLKTTRQQRGRPGKLARVYDEEGRPHVFETVKLDDDTTDRKCKVCGVMLSQIDQLHEEKIATALRENSKRYVFFRYYETKCPRGGIHQGNPCAKCKLVAGEQSVAYQREFQAQFDRERQPTAGPKVSTKNQQQVRPVEGYESYAFNYNSVVQAAKILGVNVKMLQSLGAYEKIPAANLLEGYIPPEPTKFDHPMILQLITHARKMILMLNTFRNFNPATALEATIKQAQAIGLRADELPGGLPDIYRGFNETVDWFKLNKKPRELGEYVRQFICEGLMQIAQSGRVGDILSKHIVNHLIKTELDLCQHGEFNWSLIFPDNRVSAANAVPDDDPDDVEVQQDKKDPFSMDGFDMEDADEDGEGNQLRAGDNLGM